MTKRKPKKLNKLIDQHTYYSKKVAEIENERKGDRSFNHKSLLLKLKKTKLYIKDQIEKFKNEA